MERFVKAFEEMDKIFRFRKLDTSRYDMRETAYLCVLEGYKLGGGCQDGQGLTAMDKDFFAVGMAYLKGGLELMHKVSGTKGKGQP